jgi:2-dehydropantoate 2-reductase
MGGTQTDDMSKDKPDLLIVGTGAMASLFAARCAAAGINVKMLGSWSDGLAALKQTGVHLQDTQGGEWVYPVTAYASPMECGKVHNALMLVKSWQTNEAAELLSECLSDNGVVLTLQNGFGNQEILIEILGAKRVAVGSTTAGATLLAPGVVRAAGEGIITLGVHAHVKPLADLLRAAGFVVETVSDISSVQWGKLVINAAINPITAILNIPNGDLLKRDAARSLLAFTAREAAAVAVAKGVHLPYPDPVVAVEAIARNTAQNISSMLQDVRRGAPTEIDFISGAVVRAGEQTGVSTPVNRTLWHLVKGLVQYSIEVIP